MCVQLTIISDEIGENNESLTLRINGENAAIVTILDDGRQFLMMKHVMVMLIVFICF